MSIKINDLQLNMKNVIDLFVKITSFLMTAQKGSQICHFKRAPGNINLNFIKNQRLALIFLLYYTSKKGGETRCRCRPASYQIEPP